MHMDMSQQAFEQKLTGKMPDANRGASILCEPAQSKCTWTCHNRHFEQKLTRKMPDANRGASILCEPAQSKCTWTCHNRHFVPKCAKKMPDATPAASILCEPALSKCTWTCRNRHFEQKLTRKMPDATPAASIFCEPAQSKCTWTCHNRHFEQELKRKIPDANPGASILREPAQSKCIWTCHKGHFTQKIVRKMADANARASIKSAQSKCTWTCRKKHFVRNLQGKGRTLIPGPAFRASLRNRNAHGHVTIDTRGICQMCGNFQGKWRMLIAGHTFYASLRSRNAHGHVTTGILSRNWQGKCRTLIAGQALSASLRSRNAHGSQEDTRGICAEIFKENAWECRTPIPGPAFCASLRSRKAHGHVTRGILWEIYRENVGHPGYHLDWTPARNSYRRNPSVWPHCFGKNMHLLGIIGSKSSIFRHIPIQGTVTTVPMRLILLGRWHTAPWSPVFGPQGAENVANSTRPADKHFSNAFARDWHPNVRYTFIMFQKLWTNTVSSLFVMGYQRWNFPTRPPHGRAPHPWALSVYV